MKFLFLFFLAAPLIASKSDNVGRETGLPVPRFISLGSEKINMRVGPGKRYPIKWVYIRKHLPVQIIAEFGLWRQIQDHSGEIGWVHRSLLSGKKTFRTLDRGILVKSDPSKKSQTVAIFGSGVIGQLKKCEDKWCKIRYNRSITGWVPNESIYGRSY